MVRHLSMTSHSISHGPMNKNRLAAKECAPCEPSKVGYCRPVRPVEAATTYKSTSDSE